MTPEVRGHDIARLRQERQQCGRVLAAARPAVKHDRRHLAPAPLVGDLDTIAVMKGDHSCPRYRFALRFSRG
jgi:hypothetical protein